MVAVHHHVCQRLTENLVLALICRREPIVFDMYRGIDEGAEPTQYNLHCLPDILLFRDAVSVSHFRLLDCRSRDFDVVNTESWNIAQYIRGFSKHQETSVSEQPFVRDVDLLAKLGITDITQIHKIACLSKCKPIVVQGIKVEHLDSRLLNCLLSFLAE